MFWATESSHVRNRATLLKKPHEEIKGRNVEERLLRLCGTTIPESQSSLQMTPGPLLPSDWHCKRDPKQDQQMNCQFYPRQSTDRSLVKILVLDSLGIVSSKVQIIYNAPQKWFPRCLKCPFCPEIQSSWKLEAIIIDLNVYFLKKMNLNKIANCQIVFIRWCFGIDSRRPTRKDSKLCMFLFGF